MEHRQRLRQPDAGIEKLAELVIKLGALGELARRDDQPHGPAVLAHRHRAGEAYAATRSSFALKSRLLRKPTIWSATSPFLKRRRDGMARIPYSVARPWNSSMLTFAILTLPSYSVASSSRLGATILQ